MTRSKRIVECCALTVSVMNLKEFAACSLLLDTRSNSITINRVDNNVMDHKDSESFKSI
jgi:hypothetical protein